MMQCPVLDGSVFKMLLSSCWNKYKHENINVQHSINVSFFFKGTKEEPASPLSILWLASTEKWDDKNCF